MRIFAIFLVVLVLLTNCLTSITFVSAQRCTQRRYVPKTRLKPVQRVEYYWTQNWIGFQVQKTRYRFEYETEHYNEARLESVCCPGYTQGFPNCKPICVPDCPANSRCSSPYNCTCNFGYKPTPDGFECVPECKNGCPLNMYCKSPDECACRTGYAAPIQPTEGDEQSTLSISVEECIPVCNEGCPAQSKCVAPEECRCEEGYTMFNEDDFDDNEAVTTNSSSICVPVCEQRCPLHASCMRPNHCECAAGYEYQHPPQHRPYCQAQCEQNCSTNGKCVAPNVCECFDGYEHVNSTSVSNTAAPYCQPKCANGCPHGVCFAPEVCVCNPGYLMGPRGICEPICTNNCLNGRCVEPEICACDAGFQLAAHSHSKCEPICNQTCINADCAAPDICLCQDKYKPKLDLNSGMMSAHECEPMCMPECVHADCIAPDQCRCHAGYVPSTNTSLAHICVPKCAHGCVNGICLFPEVCVCGVGLNLISNAEVSECVADVTTSRQEETATETTSNSPINDPSSTTTLISSTTISEAWFTNGLTVESLTTIVDEQHNAAALLTEQNLEKCNELCYCWKEEGEEETSQLCSEICGVHNDTCLDAKFCYCNEAELRLEYRQGELIKSFVCGVNRTATTHYRDEAKRAEPTWLLITASILIIVLTVSIVYLCVRIYQTRHETGSHEIPVRLLMGL